MPTTSKPALLIVSKQQITATAAVVQKPATIVETRPISPGEVFVTRAQKDLTYTLVDSATKNPIKNQRLLRKGDQLVIEVDGQPMIEISDFFAADIKGEGSAPVYLADEAQSGEAAVSIVGGPRPAPANIANPQESYVIWDPKDESVVALAPVVALPSGLLLGGSTAAGAVLNKVVPGTVAENFVQGVITAGDVVNGNDLKVEVYAIEANGKTGILLKSGDVDEVGFYKVSIGTYNGAVRVVVISGGGNLDYTDEATNSKVNLTTALGALGSVTGSGALVTINVTPLTELANRKNTTPTIANIASVNQAVGSAFGVADITTTTVITTTNPAYNTAASADNGKKYGTVLATLSGMNAQPGGVGNTITTLEAEVSVKPPTDTAAATASLSITGKMQLVEAAQKTAAAPGNEALSGVVTSVIDLLGASAPVTKLKKIADYAGNNTNPAPNVDDYKNAGVTGVTAANLAAVNVKIDAVAQTAADQVSEVQATVNAANISLTQISLSASTLAEKVSVGSGVVLGPLNVNDPDGNGNSGLVLSLGGADASNFAIRNGSLVFTGPSPDFERKPSYSVTVTSTDGLLVKSQHDRKRVG